MLLFLAGCVRHVESGLAPEVVAAIAAGDAAWARRDEPGQLEAAVAAWQSGLGVPPREPELLWRLSRAAWSVGVVDPGIGGPFEQGRDLGWRCLLGFDGFSSTLELGAYRVEPAAVKTLPDAAAPCVAWLLVNGVAQYERRGHGAALLLEPLRTLLPVVEAHPEVAPGFLPWVQARLGEAQDPPFSDSDLRALYERAVAEAPDVALFRRDYAATFPDARAHAWEGWNPPTTGGWARENAAWTPEGR